MMVAFETALEAHFDRKYAEYCDMLDEQDDPEEEEDEPDDD